MLFLLLFCLAGIARVHLCAIRLVIPKIVNLCRFDEFFLFPNEFLFCLEMFLSA